MNEGFGCKAAALPSPLMERQDSETDSAHKSLTLLADVKARRSLDVSQESERLMCAVSFTVLPLH